MLKNILQLFIASALLQFSLLAQNNLEINSVLKGNYNEQRSLNISINNLNKELFSIEKILLPYQSIPQIEVLSNSSILLVYSLEGIIETYNNKGSLVSQKEFYKLPPHNEQGLFSFIYDNGFAIIVSEEQKNNIFTFDNNGKIIYQKDLQDGLISGFVSSKNGNLFAASILNWNINQLDTKIFITNISDDYSLTLRNKFSKGMFNNKNNMFLGYSNKNSFLLDLNLGKILWENQLNKKEIYVEGFIEKDKVLLIKSVNPNFIDNTWIYNKIKVVEIDDAGKEIIIKSVDKSTKNIKLNKYKDKYDIILDDEKITVEIN